MDHWAAADPAAADAETSWNLLKLTAKVTSRWKAAKPPLAPGGAKSRRRSRQHDAEPAAPPGERYFGFM